MGSKSQYEKMIDTLCANAYQRIDKNYLDSLDALNIAHIYGNVIAELPPDIHTDVLQYVIKCSLRDLKKYQLTDIFLLDKIKENSVSGFSNYNFFIITQQILPDSLTNNQQLLNQWRREGEQLTAKINVIFSDQENYLARKDNCSQGRCEAEHKTGTRCHDNQCLCLPFLASHKGVKLLFIDINDQQ